MASLSLVGQDTIIINDRVINDLATSTVGSLTFDGDVAAIQVGKDGNAIFSYNAQGEQSTFDLRVIRGSSDDKFFNGLYSQQQANFVGVIVLTGVIVKKIGDGQGNISKDTYSLSGGVFIRGVDVQSNVEGDTEQGVSTWRMRFAKTVRSIG